MSASRPYFIEDERASGLGPVAALRPAFELRCGALNLRERIELALGPVAGASVRPALRPMMARTFPDWLEIEALPADEECLFLNSRLLGSVEGLADFLGNLGSQTVCRSQGAVVAARVRPDQLDADFSAFDGLAEVELPADLALVTRPWELVHANPRLIHSDFATLLNGPRPARTIYGVVFREGASRPRLLGASTFSAPIPQPGVHFVAVEQIKVGPDVILKPGVVLDASDGPILLERGVSVAANATIVGPVFLGAGSVVNPGAKIREGSSCGAFCKLGGEVEDSVLQDFSNKQHDGFLGHAHVGSWVNLGADTNGSDLKNNYGEVRVDLGEGLVGTGSAFVGPMIGDHAKSGINTMLSTGTVIGVAANVFGAGFPPRFLPPFSWGGAERLVEYRLEAALETAREVCSRREVEFGDAEAQLLAHHFENTAGLRSRLG